MAKKGKAIIESHELDNGTMKHVDTPMDYDKSFKKHDLQVQLCWESHHTEEYKYFIETTKRFGMKKFHTNTQILTRRDEAGTVEDYLCSYLTKM